MQSDPNAIGADDQQGSTSPMERPLPIVVCRATLADLETIVGFNICLAQETANKTLSRQVLGAGVRALLIDEERGRYFVARVGDEVVGQIMMFREWNDWRNGWMWWLDNVYVRDDMRHRGVLRALFGHVKQLAIDAGSVAGIRLHVAKQNLAAQTIYQQFGMRHDRLLMEQEIGRDVPSMAGRD